MAFHPSKLKALLLVTITGAVVLSVGAQQGGQPIIFSAPQTAVAQPAAPTATTESFQAGALPGTLQAPIQFFNFNPPSDRLPTPARPVDSPQQQRMKRLLEERKNWTLMTPEEILGATPAEKLLVPPDRDALGREKNPTQLERYLERESRLRNGPTNSWQSDRAAQRWNTYRDQNDTSLPDATRDGTSATARNLSQLLSGQRGQDGFLNQNGKAGWAAFGQPPPQTTPKPDLEQLAAMERFRQLLTPPAAAEPSPSSKYFPVPKPPVDSFLTQPEFVPNPAGASFTPISSGIARPTGIAPLPGVTATSFLPLAAPVTRVQPPPWLLQGPQPFVMPQRKF